MSVHGPDELDRERKAILAGTRASLMSDAKWRKLIGALDENGLSALQYVLKFVGSPTEHRTVLPTGLHAPWPWVDTQKWGPTPFRAIEWLLLPHVAERSADDWTVPTRRVEQDVEAVARIISSLGRYPLERTDRGLLIRGYLSAETPPNP